MRVAAIGGGHGLARTLQALRHLHCSTTAVVTVADDGGSSGRLRRQHDIIALGDMRRALLALAGEGELPVLLGHRFAEGEVEGHALGNLVLLAAIEQADGHIEAALERVAELLGCEGRVWPCTTADVTLVAEVDGAEIEGQVAVATTEGRHRSVWLEPTDPPACGRAVEAITQADAVLLGPGSLFTSIIPNLLVPGIREAIVQSHARLIYLTNLTRQAGETGGMDAQGHIDALRAHLSEAAPLEVLCHDGPQPVGSGPALAPVQPGPGVAVVHAADLVERGPSGLVAAHDVDRLARALADVLDLPGTR